MWNLLISNLCISPRHLTVLITAVIVNRYSTGECQALVYQSPVSTQIDRVLRLWMKIKGECTGCNSLPCMDMI